ncbi:hypothetical protein SAMN06265346_10363 [Flavobacterium hercynium]|nr:hypothetical protein SAMN06265346_10363 [Flavobacterium hercynium]
MSDRQKLSDNMTFKKPDTCGIAVLNMSLLAFSNVILYDSSRKNNALIL